MKKEYDFSNGVRGRFYHKNIKIQIPVYLDNDNMEFVEKIVRKKKSDASTVVNELLRMDRELSETMG
ncbi:MAG TPA: hypothetical protein VHO70_24705 [Chitinispirillaceae bacterium]|nr:hypothetical protein [Chitinispirillaceae bacterium]